MNINLNINLGIRIRSFGTAVARNCFTNVDILKRHPQFKDQPEARLKIFSRRIEDEYGFDTRYMSHFPNDPMSDADETSESLALSALQTCSKGALNFIPDILIHGTTTTSRYSGSQATALAGKMSWPIASYEMKAGCATATAGLHLLWMMFNSEFYKFGVVSFAETMSKLINSNYRDDWFGLADGSAALFIERNEENPQFRVIRSVFTTKGQYADLYTTPGVLPPHAAQDLSSDFTLHGDATELSRQAHIGYSELLKSLFDGQENLRKKIKWILPHQVNKQLVHQVQKDNDLSGEIFWIADKYGNIGGSTIAFAICKALEKNIFEKGDLILIMSVGGGLSLAGQLWEVT